MNKKHAFPAAILLFIILTTSLAIIIGCTKKSNPVNPLQAEMTRIATVVTPGEPEWACVYNDTVYIADNSTGIARISLSPSIRLLPSYYYGGAYRGFIWVAYDSLKQLVFGADRPSTLNRLLRSLFRSQNDTMVTWDLQWVSSNSVINNSSTCYLFHDPDTILHVVSLTNGFIVYSDSISYPPFLPPVEALVCPPLPYTPPSLSGISHAIVGKPYSFAAAEEYGFVSINTPDWYTSPTEAGHVDLPGQAVWLAKRDTICYVATKWSGIGVIGVSDPTHPHLLSMVDLPNSDNQFQIEISPNGKRLLLVDNYKGVFVFGLEDPVHPRLLGLLDINKPVSICCYRDYLIVCSEAEGTIFYRW